MSTLVRFLLPAEIHSLMVEQAHAALPNECCGALAGKMESAAICRIERCYPMVNLLASPQEYEIDPKNLLLAHRDSRRHGLEIVGFYHSHPTSDPIPSKKDREQNWWGEQVVHFIISPNTNPPDTRGWHLNHEEHSPAHWELIEDEES